MPLLVKARSFLRNLFFARRVNVDLDQEVQSHLAMLIDENTRAGMSPQEARRAARIELGGVEQVKEQVRDARTGAFFDSLLQDVRFALRQMRRSPGFTAVAVLTLALGIGANTAIFSAVNGILIEPLPYADSERLVQIEGVIRGPANSGGDLEALSIPAIRDIQAQCPAFSQVSAYGLLGETSMLGGSVPDEVRTVYVEGGFFTAMGVRPLLGRPILPADTEQGNNRVGVIDYQLWKSTFGGDPGVIGKTITLGETPTTIIGVMPPEFRQGLEEHGLWLPLNRKSFVDDRDVRMFSAIARLRAGTSIETANAQLKILSANLAAAYPKTDKGWQLSAKSAKDIMVGEVHSELLILLAAAGFVLLIACVNVSGMLLARAWSRHREVAIREVLGATRLRIIRQFLVESLLLSLAGGALGLLVAVWAIPAMRAIAPPRTPRINGLRLDLNVLWFTLAVSILSGILFGLAPALRVTGHRIGAAIKAGLGGLLAGFSARSPCRMRNALVIVEIALAVVLTTGATLVARSLQKMMSVHLGYRTDHVLTMNANIYTSGCDFNHPQVCLPVVQEILRRIQALHGVESAAAASSVPLKIGSSAQVFETQGQAGPQSWTRWIPYRVVTSGYLRLMGIPLLAGRDFTESDMRGSQAVAIVNQAFAQRFFPGASPLGQRLSKSKDKHGQLEWTLIVGEVGDTRDSAVTEAPEPEFYVSMAQDNALRNNPSFLVRTSMSPLAMADAVKHQIWSVDKDAPIASPTTLDQIVSDEVAQPRFQTILLGSFGALGLILSMVGIYGVISYSVALRTHEIGVRMALGARPEDALCMVIREGMTLASVGIVIGVGGALALTRLLRSFLFEITPTDPATFATVAVALAVAALSACYIPARRAMRVYPMVALRHE